jgi:hypothetical protein
VESATFDFRENLTQLDHDTTLVTVPFPVVSIGNTAKDPSTGPVHTNSNDPWEAAHNLAFMKRSSPANVNTRDTINEVSNGELLSIPSLASSSEGTAISPGDGVAKKNQSKLDEEKEVVDEMLLAAVAMTEFINSPPPSQQYLASLEKTARSRVHHIEKSSSKGEDEQGRLALQVKRNLAFDGKELELQKKLKRI